MENYEKEVKILNINQDMSQEIGEIALALSKAQKEMMSAHKSSTNPFFRSKYADLASVWDAARDALTKNELAVSQTTNGDGENAVVHTILMHSSGQWIRGKLTLKPTKNDPQGMGSAITYARRYTLAAIVGVVQEDDDANKASEQTQKTTTRNFVKPKLKTSTDEKSRCEDGFKKLKFSDENKSLVIGYFEKDYSKILTELTRIAKKEITTKQLIEQIVDDLERQTIA